MISLKDILLIIALIVLIQSNYYIDPIYPSWAHDHMVWINYQDQNQSEIVKMVEDYNSRGIKIGSVDIDSTWTACFNNFQWNLQRFPEPQKMIDWLHSQGLKVFVWATSVINNDCKIYDQGVKNGYFLNGGKLIKWWHGTGAFLDYLNPKAVQWWHKQLDKVLDMGIDGFKCDGTDPMIALLRPWPYSSHKNRFITTTQYSHQYYGDFYNYTKKKNPQGLIMARPTDSFKIPNPINNSSYVFLNYAPKYVMFSGWVGDQPSNFQGFKSAVWNVIHSAWNGYLNFGFDIGGYVNQKRDKFIMTREVQLGAFLPFMENGGLGQHRPWKYGEDVSEIYKKFVGIHHDLKPTFMSYAHIAYSNGESVVQPLAKRQSYTLTIKQPDTFGYILCQKLLVFPIFEQNGMTQLTFPKGSNWVYFFNQQKIFKGGQKIDLIFPLDQSPIFYRSNSILAMESGIRVIALQQGQKTQIIMSNHHTDYVSVLYQDTCFKIQIKRYLKTGQKIDDGTISLLFIGHKIKQSINREITKKQHGIWTVQVDIGDQWSVIQGLQVVKINGQQTQE